ncbi:MAG TPA: prepilin peptidase [Elusimicrobia bacterium]|nr:prepilin peptidase [Elusimicrobiota bacterium]
MIAIDLSFYDTLFYALGGAPSDARSLAFSGPSYPALVWAAFGLCLGSFANVLIHRLPREESIVRPRSRCPKCAAPIAFKDNIPVLSWLLLRGRCRNCREPISGRYPAVELLLGLLGAALAMRWSEPAWVGPALLASVGFVAIAFIDWDTLLIPDELSLGLVVLGLLASPLNPVLGYETEKLWLRPLTALVGALAGYAGCLLIAILGEKMFGKEAMGGGDLKLLAAVGAWSGALGALDCVMVASFIGAFYGMARILRRASLRYRGRLGPLLDRFARVSGRRRSPARWTLHLLRGRVHREPPIPFGPFLSAGALLNFFYLLPVGFPFTF